jgi:hypothetical protein
MSAAQKRLITTGSHLVEEDVGDGFLHLPAGPTRSRCRCLFNRLCPPREQVRQISAASTTAHIDLGLAVPAGGGHGHEAPLVWVKTAEEILDSLARYCKRISGARFQN